MPDALIVAIDGPAGSGKSSTARAVAKRLGMQYVDTGALYRAMTFWMLQRGVDVQDAGAVSEQCSEPRIECSYAEDGLVVLVDGEDASAAIRGAEVTSAVSAVSAVPAVRERLVALQRAWALGAAQGAVVEGRDIGTVVFPDAPVKVFLEANAAVRAERRMAQEASVPRDAEAAQAALLRRDELDSSREHSPLMAAADAVRIDNSGLSLDVVVERIVDLVRQASGPGSGGPGSP